MANPTRRSHSKSHRSGELSVEDRAKSPTGTARLRLATPCIVDLLCTVDSPRDSLLRHLPRLGPWRCWLGMALLIASGGIARVGVTGEVVAPEVAITTSGGEAITGELVKIDVDGVELKQGPEDSFLPLDELSQMSFDHEGQPPLPMRAQLSGGSLVSITGITWADDTVTIAVARQSPLSVPAQQLRWVRFRAGSAATDPAWLGWLEDARRADRLVVRRNDNALDSIDGTVVGIGRDSVQFEMGGNPIDAPLAKLEGVLFSNSTQAPAAPGIRLIDTAGSQWMAQTISMAAGSAGVKLGLAGGIEHEIPIAQVRQIHFAGGILALSEAEVAATKFGPEPNGGAETAVAAGLDAWFAPRSEEGVIAINAPGAITLRIPEGYQKLIVAARRSRDVSQFTALRLDVLVDGEVRWTATLQNRESLGLELPISGARQLTLRASPMSETSDPASSAHAALGGGVEWFSGRLLK